MPEPEKENPSKGQNMTNNPNSLPSTPPQERKVLGLVLGDYVRMVLTFSLGIVASGLFLWLNAKAPYLRQTVPSVIRFNGDKSQFGMVNFTVTNDGYKEAEDVDCSFDLTGCTIQEVMVTPKNLNPDVSWKDSHASVKVKMLNATEAVQVSAIVANPDKLSDTCNVSVRGRGVVGEYKASPSGTSATITPVASLFLATPLFFFALMIWMTLHYEYATKKLAASTKQTEKKTPENESSQ